MTVAAICDACRGPLVDRTFSVQVQGADLYTTSAGLHARSPDHLRAYILCSDCMSIVRGAIEYVLQGQPLPEAAAQSEDLAAPPAAAPQPAEAPAPIPELAPLSRPAPRRAYEGYDEVVRDPGEAGRSIFEG